MIMEPDVIICVRFKTADEGGRRTPIEGSIYSCPLFVDGEGFDSRIFVENQKIDLGEWYRLPVKFLLRDAAILKLSPGKRVTLWEGRDVADGMVIEVR